MYIFDFMSVTKYKSLTGFSSIFILSANFEQKRSKEEIKKMLFWTLLTAFILSGVRQILRLRLQTDHASAISINNPLDNIDEVNVIITMILTVTFYPLLYKAYSFVYKGTEEKGTEHILYRVALLSQLAILRDLLYILYVFTDFWSHLFEDGEIDYVDIVFINLDAILWFLTIILFVPIVIPRLNKPKSQDDTLIQAFIVSFITFWLTWVFNFVILRVFIELPFGGRMFS